MAFDFDNMLKPKFIEKLPKSKLTKVEALKLCILLFILALLFSFAGTSLIKCALGA